MKKVLFFALAVFFGLTAMAQHLYEGEHLYQEDFNGLTGLPSGWSADSYYWLPDYAWLHFQDAEGDNGLIYSRWPGDADSIWTGRRYKAVYNELFTRSYELSLADTTAYLSFDLTTLTMEENPSREAVSHVVVYFFVGNDTAGMQPLEARIINSYSSDVYGESVSMSIGNAREALGLQVATQNYTFVIIHLDSEGDASFLTLDNFRLGTARYLASFGYDVGQGVTGSMDDIYTDGNGVLVMPENAFTREKHTFVYWYAAINHGEIEYYVEPGDSASLFQDVHFVAQWRKNLTIHYDANGGEGEMADDMVLKFEEFPLPGNELILPDCGFTYDGYRFVGWSDEPEGEAFHAGLSVYFEDDEDVTLYAIWAPVTGEEVTVSYDANGGTGTMGSDMMAVGDVYYIRVALYEREGYTQTGWNTSADGSGRAYELNAYFTVRDNVTLYAQWKKDEVAGIASVNNVAVRLYPNPTHDMVRVDASGLTLSRLELMDLTGRVVRSVENRDNMDLSGLAHGTYMMRVIAAEGTAIRKVVKQ